MEGGVGAEGVTKDHLAREPIVRLADVEIEGVRHRRDGAGVLGPGGADAEGRYALLRHSVAASQSSPKSFRVWGNGLPVSRS